MSISSVLDVIARGSATGANCVQVDPDQDPNYVTIRNSKKRHIFYRLPIEVFEASLRDLKADEYDGESGLKIEVIMTHETWDGPLRFNPLELYHFVDGAKLGEFDKLGNPKKRHFFYRIGKLIERIGKLIARL
jgi:hypothetical protein